MKLRCKFILAIGTILTLSYGVLLFYVSIVQNRLVIEQAEQQARMLHEQILLTRQWVADHHGLFVIRSDRDKPNRFLEHPVFHSEEGVVLVKRNPAMVTRELSEYAVNSRFCWFRVTSLSPVNPANKPDEFEKNSLRLFNQGVPELIKITHGKHGRILRYIAPLTVKKSCMDCHARHGYNEGDIRGALSISIPISWADATIARNNRSIILFGMISITVVSLALYFLFSSLVARPIDRLARSMEKYPAKSPRNDLPAGHDEIGKLSADFSRLCKRLEQSNNELEQAREQAFRNEKLAALGQLTAGIAHEINNPLGGMLNCVKAMQQDPENIELHTRYLILLDKGLHRIEHTMRQLLNFGRTDPLRLRKGNIDQVIRECLELLEYQLQGIELKLDLQLPTSYCIDIEAVKQIVMNISLNAIQAMPDGGTFQVTSRLEGDAITLRFKDTGIGIDPGIINKIFDPFFTTKEVGKGTGLGLAVSNKLVNRMRGRIEVESSPGQGCCFILTLPMELNCPAANELQDKNMRKNHGTNTAD
jgi:signal transduction histidine kinase